MSSLGETLRHFRERAHLSQREAARRAGVNQSTISRWERGISSPTVAQLLNLVDVYEQVVGDALLAELDITG